MVESRFCCVHMYRLSLYNTPNEIVIIVIEYRSAIVKLDVHIVNGPTVNKHCQTHIYDLKCRPHEVTLAIGPNVFLQNSCNHGHVLSTGPDLWKARGTA